MRTLHEMAMKLQDYIIDQQQNSHDVSGLKVNRYSNLKLTMDLKLRTPHVIVTIGISEACYNLTDCSRMDGGLGADEKYVKKWLEGSLNLSDLKSIYDSLEDLVHEEGAENGELKGEASSSTTESRTNLKRLRSIDDINDKKSNVFRRYLKRHPDAEYPEQEKNKFTSDDNIEDFYND